MKLDFEMRTVCGRLKFYPIDQQLVALFAAVDPTKKCLSVKQMKALLLAGVRVNVDELSIAQLVAILKIND